MKILEFNKDRDKISCDEILEQAKGNCSTVIVVGINQEGEYYSGWSTLESAGDILMLARLLEEEAVQLLTGE